MMKQPNILLLMCDQFRGDCLSYAGHPDVKTPYLDTLASDGAFFDRAYSSCPSCILQELRFLPGKVKSTTDVSDMRMVSTGTTITCSQKSSVHTDTRHSVLERCMYIR